MGLCSSENSHPCFSLSLPVPTPTPPPAHSNLPHCCVCFLGWQPPSQPLPLPRLQMMSVFTVAGASGETKAIRTSCKVFENVCMHACISWAQLEKSLNLKPGCSLMSPGLCVSIFGIPQSLIRWVSPRPHALPVMSPVCD